MGTESTRGARLREVNALSRGDGILADGAIGEHRGAVDARGAAAVVQALQPDEAGLHDFEAYVALERALRFVSLGLRRRDPLRGLDLDLL